MNSEVLQTDMADAMKVLNECPSGRSGKVPLNYTPNFFEFPISNLDFFESDSNFSKNLNYFGARKSTSRTR